METTDSLDEENHKYFENKPHLHYNLVKYSCDTSYNIIFVI